MSRSTLASNPFLLGFERLDELVERAARASSDGYPPFNIAQFGEDRYCITLAVAGFGTADLSVAVEGGNLIVRGKRAASDKGREFLHRGIATRQFQRSFVLADGVEVTGARLDKGLLHVELERATLEPEITRIPIRTQA
ncbi:MAG: Hsp20 family protein [Pseudomonadota bacterium]